MSLRFLLLRYIHYEGLIVKRIVECIIDILACFDHRLLFKHVLPLLLLLFLAKLACLRTLRLERGGRVVESRV